MIAQRTLVVVAAVVAAGMALVHGQVRGADPIERVTLRSGSYADFRQVFVREAPAGVSVSATLRFPDRTRDRYPAVVVVHRITGFQEVNEGWLAAELRRSGFATLTYDTFSARGLSQSAVVASRAGPPLASGVADAFAALQFLAGHPRIAADRIGIVGFSFGGEVAHLPAFETLRAAMGAGPARFAAHVATYPGGTYGARAEAGAYTGAPILMLRVIRRRSRRWSIGARSTPGPYPPWAPRAFTPSTSPARGSVPSSCSGAGGRPPCSWTGASDRSTRRRSPRARPRGGLLDGVRRGHPHQIRRGHDGFSPASPAPVKRGQDRRVCGTPVARPRQPIRSGST